MVGTLVGYTHFGYRVLVGGKVVEARHVKEVENSTELVCAPECDRDNEKNYITCKFNDDSDGESEKSEPDMNENETSDFNTDDENDDVFRENVNNKNVNKNKNNQTVNSNRQDETCERRRSTRQKRVT